MKVLLINGSSRLNGNTFNSLKICEKILQEEGIETEIFQIGNKPMRDCIGCGSCKNFHCVFDDDLANTLIDKMASCDGFVVGTPVYYSHPSGRLLSLFDRVSYAGGRLFMQKPVLSLAVARRAGTIAAMDALNKHFTINQMPLISSTYWTEIHGANPGEVVQDLEGVETLENGARNLAWIIKCINIAKENGVNPPKNKKHNWTNFIR